MSSLTYFKYMHAKLYSIEYIFLFHRPPELEGFLDQIIGRFPSTQQNALQVYYTLVNYYILSLQMRYFSIENVTKYSTNVYI